MLNKAIWISSTCHYLFSACHTVYYQFFYFLNNTLSLGKESSISILLDGGKKSFKKYQDGSRTQIRDYGGSQLLVDRDKSKPT